MGEENRESSGSGTAMAVIGIVAAVTIFLCCGGFVFGLGSLVYFGSEVDVEVIEAPPMPQAPMEMQFPKMPAEGPFVPPPESLPSTSPPLDSKSELESPPGTTTDDGK